MTNFSLDHGAHHFTAVRTGGGLQTRSLHLLDQDGTEWVLRSVRKNPVSWLKPFWRKTFIRKIVEDQISGSHPYGALVVPPLADALQIDHNNPELILVQDDSALGKFRSEFANRLCFLEERNPKGKTISTEKLLALRDSLPNIYIDSVTYLKCRLLDIVIGDWDRHPDQYRWYAVKDKDGLVMYKPIPNDRDQVFFQTRGLIPGLVRGLGFMKYLEGFRTRVKNINGFMLRGQKLDRKILSHFSETDWEMITRSVVNNLNDSILKSALEKLPPEIHWQNDLLFKKMQSRRNSLPQLSASYFRHIIQ